MFQKHLSYANVIGSVALFVALGGSAAAAAPQIRKDAVRSPEIQADAVRSSEIRDESITLTDDALDSTG